VRYERLNLNPAVGHKIKEELIGRGLIEQQVVDLGKTRKALLRLTKKGEMFFEEVQACGNESIVHGYWKRFYAGRFRNAGYQVKEEVERNSGWVDVLATRKKEMVAIEIETGKSDVVKNVKADLAMGYARIIVVATDKEAFGKVERDLVRAGLLGLDRIRVVLQDGYFVESDLDVEIG